MACKKNSYLTSNWEAKASMPKRKKNIHKKNSDELINFESTPLSRASSNAVEGVAQALWGGMKNHKYFLWCRIFLSLSRARVSQWKREGSSSKKYENEMNYDFQIEKWENLYLMKDGLRERTREVSGKSNQRQRRLYRRWNDFLLLFDA